ncbi:uncharacterized protein LOC143450081 [Clavelina lepadiformis]|uniref:uncharacterized protein LOC143450081 n=1 Tax=Clavelina lepadiformis TaxID=159417 RepID=UPI00404386B0
MPISSTNSRLTYEFYKPPPKTLEQIRMEERGVMSSPALNGSRMNTPGTPGGSIKREKHLDQIPGKKTAVVGPMNDVNGLGKSNNAFAAGDVGKSAVKKSTLGGGNHVTTAWNSTTNARACSRLCCLCNGFYFTRCFFLALLLGLLLGALITGLAVGLTLDQQLQDTNAALEDANEDTGCFQSPCASGEVASCNYLNNNTEINCQCSPLVGDPVSTAGVSAGGYRCTFYNITSTTLSPIAAT